MAGNPGLGGLLAIADFRKVWAVGALSGLVRWVEMLAFAVYIFDISNSPFQVALVSLLRILPLALFGAPLGVLADRVDRRKIVLAGLIGMLALDLWLAWLGFSGRLEIWHLMAGAFINGLYWATDMPARRTLLSAIAGSARTAPAMAIDASTSSLTRALGPAAGGLLVAFTGLPGALLLGAGIYALAIVFMLSLPRRDRGGAASDLGPWRALKEGLAHAARDRTIVGVLIVTVIFNVWVFPYTAMIAVIGRDVLGLGPFNVGLLMSMEGIGAFIGAMAVAFLGKPAAHGGIYLFGAIAAGISLIGFALSTSPLLSGLILVLAGIGAGCFASMQATLMLLLAPPEARSRLMGVLSVCIGLGPLGFAHLGLLADWLGAERAMIVMGLEGLCAFALAWLFWPEVRSSARAQLKKMRSDSQEKSH
jgi:MFS family permease